MVKKSKKVVEEEVVNGSLNEVEVTVKEEEVVIPSDEDTKGPDTGEAKGSDASEASSEVVSSEVAESSEAPAKEESDTEEVSTEQAEEVLPLTVYLTFDEDKDNIALEVTENFQMDLRKVCNEQGARFTEFNIEGDLSSENLRLLLKALK